MIQSLTQAARESAETFTRRAFITQTWELYLDDWPMKNITLPKPPIQSVVSVVYYDEDETEYTFDSAKYYVDTISEPGRIVLNADASFPTTTLRPANGVKVTFDAGYTSVPQAIQQAMKLIVGNWYANREEVIIGSIVTELPYAAKMLLWQHRVRL